MAINIIIKVLDSVSEEAELSPAPPMHPDEDPSSTKKQPQRRQLLGVFISEKRRNVGWDCSQHVPGLNAKSKAAGPADHLE